MCIVHAQLHQNTMTLRYAQGQSDKFILLLRANTKQQSILGHARSLLFTTIWGVIMLQKERRSSGKNLVY
jgi:hypothetical protein